MDTLTPSQRSVRMSRVRGRDTGPELTLRRRLFAMKFRYRLHDKRLPGKPDLVFAGRRKVVFVHGCFWHRHAGCRLARMPKSRIEFWEPKLSANQQRDIAVLQALEELGWQTYVIWECELEHPDDAAERVARFLRS